MIAAVRSSCACAFANAAPASEPGAGPPVCIMLGGGLISVLDIPTTEVESSGERHTLPPTNLLEFAGALVIVVAARTAHCDAVLRTISGLLGGGIGPRDAVTGG